jgi:phosphinothricin acetyltransferase
MAVLEDAKRLCEIYNPYITDTTITFEYEPLSQEAFRLRMEAVLEKFPWLVCEKDGVILGYAYASPFHERAGYAWDCDFSIYLRPEFFGQGIGRGLWQAMEALLSLQGYQNVYALITDTNCSSIYFHEKCGFTKEGEHKNSGYKLGEWLGVCLMVKKIGRFENPPAPVKRLCEIPYMDLLERRELLWT